ncbi:MAG: hypothetical protein IJM30_07875 [Thermoguttaceae bacterium]|nr:hypothetical protein [Thermoguttaceae bacterium]
MKKSFFSQFVAKADQSRAARASSLRVETLEERQLLSATDIASLADVVSAPVVEVAASAADEAPVVEFAINDATEELNARDLEVVESLGMTATDQGVVWNDQGRLTSLTISDSTIATVDISGCDALETFAVSGAKVNARFALSTLKANGCSALKTLNLGYCSLTNVNLTGCSALETLQCYYSENLEELDLSDCSSLINLWAFNCYLGSLDVSNCPNLQTLRVSTNNLSALDVSNNPELTSLLCFANNISSLDVSNCSKLESLNCHSNPIATLDCSGLDKLQTLYCKDMGATSVLIDDCSALKTIQAGGNAFSSLSTDGCSELTTVDLTGCENLTELTCWGQAKLSRVVVSGCSSLQTLDCSWNQVKTLLVAGCSSLKTLDCGGNSGLTSVDVSACPALETLRVYFSGVSSLDLSNNSALTTLFITECPIQTLDVSALPNLQKLQMGSTQISSLDLSNNSELTQLVCQETPLTALDLSNNPKLTRLTCYDCALTSLDISGCSLLTGLNCSGNQIATLTLDGATALKTLQAGGNTFSELDLSPCVALQTLDLTGCEGLTSLDARGLALQRVVVDGCSALESLDVSGSAPSRPATNNVGYIGTTGCAALKTLKCGYNEALDELDLSTNAALETLQCYYCSLEALDLSANAALKDLQGFNNLLTALDVSNNIALERLMVANNQIETLDLSNNPELTTVNCFSNALTSLDVSGCVKLTSINCHSNQIASLDCSGMTDLTQLFCKNNGMTTLVVDDCAAISSLQAGGNLFSTLDLSDCSVLGLVDLEGSENLTSLEIPGGKVYRVVVSGCSALESLTCENANPASTKNSIVLAVGCRALQTANLANSPFKTLTFTGASSLADLDVSGNSTLTELDASAAVATELDLDDATALARLAIGSNVETLRLAREVEINVSVSKADDWDALTVADADGNAIQTTTGADAVSFALATGAADPITIVYTANGSQVKTTEINPSDVVPTLDAVVVSSITVKNDSFTVDFQGVDNALYYRVLYSKNENFAPVKQVAYAKPGAKTISNLEFDTTYYVCVKAVGDKANFLDSSSEILTATTPDMPTLETPILSTAATASAIVVNVKPVEGAQKYELEYSANPDFSDSVVKTYATSGAKTFSNLPFGATYHFRVKATGEGYYDSEYAETVSAVGLLAAPTAQVADVQRDSVSVKLGAVQKASGYIVEYATSPDFANSETATFENAGTKAIVGLDSNATYYFRAKALGDGQTRIDSPWTEFSATTLEYLGDLAAPTLSASATKNAVVLKIGKVADATKYVVEFSTDADFATVSTRTFASGVRTISGLTAGTSYYFRVKATAPKYGDSDWVEATATTKNAASAAILDAAFENYFDEELELGFEL